MKLALALAAFSLAVSSTAWAQDPGSAGWVESGPTATAVKANMRVPVSAGTLKKTALKDFGRNGIDLYAQYESTDQAVTGTLFIYLPTLPDTGLTFLATDEAIRRRFGESTHVADDKLTGVAGVPNAGRRVIYEGVTGGTRVSGAIFVRAGSWMIVDRVTGPASRADEIKRDLDALLAGVTFSKGEEPLPAHVIRTEQCQASTALGDAKTIAPESAEAIALALVSAGATDDEHGRAVENPLRKLPDRVCLESNETRNNFPLLTFRALEKQDMPFSPRRFVLYGDAGVMLELTEPKKEAGSYFVLLHGVGKMSIIGRFDREPSAAQLWAMIASPDQSNPVAHYESRFISRNGNEDFTVFCRVTKEGCPPEAPGPAKN